MPLPQVNRFGIEEFIRELEKASRHPGDMRAFTTYHFNRLRNENPLCVHFLDVINAMINEKKDPETALLIQDACICMYRLLEVAERVQGSTTPGLMTEEEWSLQNEKSLAAVQKIIDRMTRK